MVHPSLDRRRAPLYRLLPESPGGRGPGERFSWLHPEHRSALTAHRLRACGSRLPTYAGRHRAFRARGPGPAPGGNAGVNVPARGAGGSRAARRGRPPPPAPLRLDRLPSPCDGPLSDSATCERRYEIEVRARPGGRSGPGNGHHRPTQARPARRPRPGAEASPRAEVLIADSWLRHLAKLADSARVRGAWPSAFPRLARGRPCDIRDGCSTSSSKVNGK